MINELMNCVFVVVWEGEKTNDKKKTNSGAVDYDNFFPSKMVAPLYPLIGVN